MSSPRTFTPEILRLCLSTLRGPKDTARALGELLGAMDVHATRDQSDALEAVCDDLGMDPEHRDEMLRAYLEAWE